MEVAIEMGDEDGRIQVVIGNGEPHGMDEETHGEGRRSGIRKEGRRGDPRIEGNRVRGDAPDATLGDWPS